MDDSVRIIKELDPQGEWTIVCLDYSSKLKGVAFRSRLEKERKHDYKYHAMHILIREVELERNIYGKTEHIMTSFRRRAKTGRLDLGRTGYNIEDGLASAFFRVKRVPAEVFDRFTKEMMLEEAQKAAVEAAIKQGCEADWKLFCADITLAAQTPHTKRPRKCRGALASMKSGKLSYSSRTNEVPLHSPHALMRCFENTGLTEQTPIPETNSIPADATTNDETSAKLHSTTTSIHRSTSSHAREDTPVFNPGSDVSSKPSKDKKRKASHFDESVAYVAPVIKEAVGIFGEEPDQWKVTFAWEEGINQGSDAISGPSTGWGLSLRIEWNGNIVFANDIIGKQSDKSQQISKNIENKLRSWIEQMPKLAGILGEAALREHNWSELSRKHLPVVVQPALSLFEAYKGLESEVHQWEGTLQNNAEVGWIKSGSRQP